MSSPTPPPGRPLSLCVVGAGPRTLVLLQRLGAHLGGDSLDVHVVDPFDSGAGRTWREAQDPLLWMNSRAADITVLPDDSVTGLTGPVTRGPSLAEWIRENRAELVRDAAADGEDVLLEEVRRSGPGSFVSRRLASRYLGAAWRRTLDGLPPNLRVHRHARTVLDVLDADDGRQRVQLVGPGEPLTVDVVLLVQGHLDVRPGPRERRTSTFARSHGLAYVPPGYTGDQDLDVLRPGTDVVVVGMGLAFVDLVVLLTEGRGGRFEELPDGNLEYHPSGAEPRLHAGSRRGVPHRSKIGYPAPTGLGLPHHYSAEVVEERFGSAELDLRSDLWPLIVKEMAGAHYRELFRTHRERTVVAPAEFDARFARSPWGSAELDHLVERAVPDPRDRFDVTALDRPLEGWWGTSEDEVHERVLRHLEDDRERRADPAHSPDAAALAALLSAYAVTLGLHSAGRLNARSTALDLDGWWHGFFSYVASGPPPQRLRQLAALARAGVLRFLGADVHVEPDPEAGVFLASSASGPHQVRARGLVEARLPVPDLERTSDVLLTRLRERGEVRAHQLVDGEVRLSNGRVVVDGSGRLVRADDSVHPRRFATGAWVAGEAGAAAFARPRSNAERVRRSDRQAAELLRAVRSRPTARRPVETRSELPGERGR